MELSQKSLTGIQKFFLFQVPMNIQKDWKAKLESAYSFMLKYSKITVSSILFNYDPFGCILISDAFPTNFGGL